MSNTQSELEQMLDKYDEDIAKSLSDDASINPRLKLIAAIEKLMVRERTEFEMLRSLCMMYEQYCSGKFGHDFMGAGESAIEILEKYNLAKDQFHIADDWEDRLKQLEEKQ